MAMADKRKSSRRDFLKGRAAADAIADLLPAEPAAAGHTGAPSPGEPPAAYLLQVGRDAMACEFQVLLNAGQHEGATEAALEALDLVDELEDQLTVYRDHSEVSRLNRAAAEGPVVVESRLFALLERAVAIHAETGHAFDITAGPLTRAWGFFRREGRLPDQAALDATRRQVGSQWLELDAAASSVRFLRPGLEINLGAIGKGYALDRCAERLLALGVDDFLVHGGRSSVLAHGSRQADDGGDGWSIALRHPLRHQQRLAEIRLRDRALGTSGSGNQFFQFQGHRYGHVIDPRSGRPADDLLSASVLAPTAADADALATACFVMGLDASLEYCAAHPELAAIFVRPGPRAGEMEIVTHGLTDRDWRRL